MRDAAGHIDAAQVLEYRVLRTPHVQQNRQIKVAGYLELFAIKIFLLLAQGAIAQARHKKIQPDFTDRDHGWISLNFPQLRYGCEIFFIHIPRMHADCAADILAPPADR